ncbi:O-linked N-acetylglucosamine transferase, SPINDLY family protein [Leptolyngbya sp. GB1-A1]|uniref:O-linked N-acetylglucosamine transferase, SPINDLY family protein n=1 Tax=Leptolyngbya sp. GB1-A1 TaxID=2933908 RepID=UPI003298B180
MSQLTLPQAPEVLNSELHQSAQSAFSAGNYASAALLYEQLAEQEPDRVCYFWMLGLAHLLSGAEAEAQLTWMMPLAEVEAEQIDQLTADLIGMLEAQAEQFEAVKSWQQSWLIRQHIREIAPENVLNLLYLLRLGISLELLNDEYIRGLNIVALLRLSPTLDLDEKQLLQAVCQVVDFGYPDQQAIAFAEAAMQHVQTPEAVFDILLDHAYRLYHYDTKGAVELVAFYGELCLPYGESHPDTLRLLSAAYSQLKRFRESIDYARQFRAAAAALEDKIAANGLLGSRMQRAGYCWEETAALFEESKGYLKQLFEQPQDDRELQPLVISQGFFYGYFLEDNPAELRPLQNKVGSLVQNSLRNSVKDLLEAEPYQQRFSAPVIQAARTQRKLRIAYIAHYMQRHPVGFLARWLLKYHDRDRYDIYTYHVDCKHVTEFTKQWFVKSSSRLPERRNGYASARFDDGNSIGIAKHICEHDQIDILIDLDSLTSNNTCGVMALRPAPIQVTWLGLDASGIPAIDYYLADPYVLPESAQDYYSEKIWRLPQTYLAIDGFEVGVPTLRRDRLGIPQDAVIYLTAQNGQKRHPDTVRLQLRVLKNVPNSYLLVRGLADEGMLQSLFNQLAEEEGVSLDRLRFLPRDADEETHRANLAIADVVLDTFPYNGATTTMETLWMGVPIVTKVGQQWAARNSYAMMTNAGISEGIAQTDEEYIAWGIRLGEDAQLREQISLKLKQSRQTSPLWDSEKFAREVEHAYEQMWDLHLQQERFGWT